MKELQKRLITSSIAVTLTLLSIYFATYPLFQPIFTLFLASLISIALWEYYQIAKIKGVFPPIPLAIACAIAYTFAVYLSTQNTLFTLLPQVMLLFTLFLLFAYFFVETKDVFMTLATTLFGFVYLVLPLATALNITYFTPHGRYLLFFTIFVTKMTDTGGYFIGKHFGKHKFAPFISPNKTWEGALSGMILALTSGFILNAFHPLFTLPKVFILSCLIGLLALFGDLAESLLKRDGGIKDSNQLPGLGGVLDMVDSLVFTLPLMYIYLYQEALL